MADGVEVDKLAGILGAILVECSLAPGEERLRGPDEHAALDAVTKLRAERDAALRAGRGR